MYHFKQSTNDKCICGKRETLECLLHSCSNYKHKQLELKEKLNGNPLSMKLLLHTNRGVQATVDYIKSTGISTQAWHLSRKE